jgi:hypothetical protein
MMILLGQNGEREITDVIDKDKSIQIMYAERARLTIRKSTDNEYIMVIEDVNPDGSKKDVYSFADVKFLDNELRLPK